MFNKCCMLGLNKCKKPEQIIIIIITTPILLNLKLVLCAKSPAVYKKILSLYQLHYDNA
jgi:hypothetical protein